MKRLAVVIAVILMAGCATGYQSSDESITGGFSEIRLAPETWRVLVEGNGMTSRSAAEKILMRRCAELTLEQGKRYFVLESHDAWLARRVSRSSDGSVSVHFAPRNEAVVTALATKESNAFDAIRIVAETDELAEGKLSQTARRTIAELGAS
jgi:hypothetical protein